MYNYKATLSRVIDGDTVDLIVDLGFRVKLKERFRLSGINAPEVRTRDLEEKEKGVRSAGFVENYFSKNKTVYLKVNGKDKYGRWLAEIYSDEYSTISLNTMLLEAGLAENY